MLRKIAVLGSGNGGLAAAADLSLRGYDVRLHSHRPKLLAAIEDAGGILLSGVVGEGRANITMLSTDIRCVVEGADLVMLVAPAPAVERYAERLASTLQPGQCLFLNPGGTGGSLALAQALRRYGASTQVRICEVSTLTYACRASGPDSVTISNLAPRVPFAAYPGRHVDELYGVVHEIYPSIRIHRSVLDTGIANLNAVEHPPQVLMNAGWIEHTRGDFLFYSDGTTPSVGRVIDAVDTERMSLAAALGVPAIDFPTMFYEAGYTSRRAAESGSAYECLQASEANRAFRAPPTMDHRYVHEDVGYGLVPWAAWAAMAGVHMPVIESLITLASTVSGRDYRREGLSLERMGLRGLKRDELHGALESGWLSRSS